MRSAWQLAPDVCYLNHGGYGGVPRPVAEAQQQIRARIEANPTRFFTVDLAELLEEARHRLAEFFRGDPDGLVFVANATTGVQTVLTSLPLDSTSQIVTTNHAYGAVRVQLDVLARRTGCSVREVPIDLPVSDPEVVAAAVVSALGPTTTLLVVDHVAAPSGLVFPVGRIAAAARALGVPVLVDGAHAAGMLPVDLADLGVDFWVGNLHKWLCAPRAAAALWIAPPWRERVRPLVPAAQYDEGLRPAFDWTGTIDPTPMLAASAALDFFAQLGWDAVRRRNKEVAAEGAHLVASALGTDVPIGDGLSGSLRIADLGQVMDADAARTLERHLYTDHRIQVPITAVNGYRWIRLSAQLYNEVEDYQQLADVLPALLNGKG